jgi:hypothetical protein
MGVQIPILELSPEQQDLWRRVLELWELSRGRDGGRIRSALHPLYVGWDMNQPLPHHRDAAMRSVCGDAPELREYELHPLSVQVYERGVGVVHYAYSAAVVPKGQSPIAVTGRWSEVYLKRDGTWIMISVSGRPDAAPHHD